MRVAARHTRTCLPPDFQRLHWGVTMRELRRCAGLGISSAAPPARSSCRGSDPLPVASAWGRRPTTSAVPGSLAPRGPGRVLPREEGGVTDHELGEDLVYRCVRLRLAESHRGPLSTEPDPSHRPFLRSRAGRPWPNPQPTRSREPPKIRKSGDMFLFKGDVGSASKLRRSVRINSALLRAA
jgi:hypothetical protein